LLPMEASAGEMKKRAAARIVVVDAKGRRVPSARPSAASQIFDVTVAPGFQLIFSPDTINISVGDTVRWTWDSGGHSVTGGENCSANSEFCSPDDMNCGALNLSDAGA